MDITYKYTILSVDENARCMEVVYEADGHETTHVGARLPYVGEDLEDVIKMFAPVPLWIAKATPVVAPVAGVSGIVSPVVVEVLPEPVVDNTGAGFPVNYAG